MLLKDKGLNLKPEKAWLEGTNVKAAIKENPAMVRGWLMAEVGRLIKTPEILECLCKYEGEVRAEIIERLHRERKSENFKPIERNKDYKPLGEYLKDVLNEPIPKREFDRAGTRLKKKLEKEYPNPDETP